MTNPDGQTGSLVGGFIIKNPAPTITGITPNTGARGWSASITNLAGSNFMSGAVVKLVNTSAGPEITATNVVVVSATRITCTFDLTGAAAARRNVTVTNPYSDPGTLLNGFTVTSNQPVVTSSTLQPVSRELRSASRILRVPAFSQVLPWSTAREHIPSP